MEQHSIDSRLELVCLAAQLILENGGETYRVEETAARMAKGLGLPDAHIAAFPTSIFVEAVGQARLRRISRRGNDMKRLALTNDVSRRVERGQLSFEESQRLLEGAAAAPGPSQLTLMLGCGLAAASFSLLFGGRLGTFAVAFVIGVLVQAIHPLFSQMEMGVLFGNFTGGLITAIAADAVSWVIPYGSVNAAIVGGIMPLLSGLLMTNAVRDTMYGDLISGVTRAVEALLLAASVALGVYVGLELAAMLGGVLL